MVLFMADKSIRQLRVAREVREALSHVILYDGLLCGVNLDALSVVKVDMTRDLRIAYVTVICRNDSGAAGALRALRVKSGAILYALMKRVRLRYAPTLYFKMDDTSECEDRVAKLEELIDAASGLSHVSGGSGGCSGDGDGAD